MLRNVNTLQHLHFSRANAMKRCATAGSTPSTHAQTHSLLLLHITPFLLALLSAIYPAQRCSCRRSGAASAGQQTAPIGGDEILKRSTWRLHDGMPTAVPVPIVCVTFLLLSYPCRSCPPYCARNKKHRGRTFPATGDESVCAAVQACVITSKFDEILMPRQG